MSESPFFSIGMPAHNAEKYLKRAVDSVLQQSFADFELVCCNDGSTDQTAGFLKEYAEADSRIRVIENTVNLGIVRTREKICRNASGKFFVWIDADDALIEGCLERLYAFFAKEENVDRILIQNAYIQNGDIRKLLYHEKSQRYSALEMQSKMVLSNTFGSYPWSIIGRVEYFRKTVYPKNPREYIDDQVASYQYLTCAADVWFDESPNYVHYLYEASDSHSDLFYVRLSNTYEYMAQTVGEQLSFLQLPLRLMAYLNKGFYYAKLNDGNNEFNAMTKLCQLAKEVRKSRMFTWNALSRIGKKQKIQILWMCYAPATFYKYYNQRRMLR